MSRVCAGVGPMLAGAAARVEDELPGPVQRGTLTSPTCGDAPAQDAAVARAGAPHGRRQGADAPPSGATGG
jgi:hypothetical protein